MKLSIMRLLADRVRLELPSSRADEPHTIELRHGVNVHGTIDTSDGTRLEQVAADHLDITRVRWHFGARPLDLGATTLEGVQIDLHIPKEGPALGTIAANALHGLGIDFVLAADEGRRVHADRLFAKDIVMRFAADGLHLEVGQLELGIGVARLGAQDIAWRDVRATRLVLHIPHVAGTTVAVDELILDGVAVVLEHLMPATHERTQDDRIADAEAELQEANDPLARADKQLVAARDWSFLDTISGSVDVDLSLDVSIPLIKHFKGKNAFRIPIEAGVIDYKKTEHQLTTIIDAFIDIELQDDRLILEKDLPMVPDDEKVLYYWPLSAAERVLAADDKVRLSTLMRVTKPGRSQAELAEQAEDAAAEKADAIADKAAGEAVEKKAIRLLGIDLDNVDVQLELGRAETEVGGGSLVIGGDGEGGGALSVTGAFHYRAEGDKPGDAGELRVALHHLALAARDVRLGDNVTLSGAVRGDIDEVVVRLGDYAARTLALRAETITLSGASIALAPKAA